MNDGFKFAVLAVAAAAATSTDGADAFAIVGAKATLSVRWCFVAQ